MTTDELFQAIVELEPTAFRRCPDSDGLVSFATARYPNMVTSVGETNGLSAGESARIALKARANHVVDGMFVCEDASQNQEVFVERMRGQQ